MRIEYILETSHRLPFFSRWCYRATTIDGATDLRPRAASRRCTSEKTVRRVEWAPAVWAGRAHHDRGIARCPPAAVLLVPPRRPPPRRHRRRPALPPTSIGHSSPVLLLRLHVRTNNVSNGRDTHASSFPSFIISSICILHVSRCHPVSTLDHFVGECNFILVII